MKNKKLFLPTIILIAAILATAVYSVVFSIAKKPAITEAEFPFKITYEQDGETIVIDDVYKARYTDNGGYADSKGRNYTGGIGANGENETIYVLKEEENLRIELWTHFYAEYMMGDGTEYDYFGDDQFEPRIYCFDGQGVEYSDEETLSSHGVKIISFEYPAPIKNKFVFSHISHLSSTAVPVLILISLLALLATIIFVRKEKELKYRTIDIISIIFNFIICFTIFPFVSIVAMLIDIAGGGPEFSYQAFYFIPSLTVLSVTVSTALRRKGYAKSSLITQFIGPAVFGVYLVICGLLQML